MTCTLAAAYAPLAKIARAIRSGGEEKAFIDRLSSLGSRVLLFPSLIPLKAELITDDRVHTRERKNGTAVKPH